MTAAADKARAVAHYVPMAAEALALQALAKSKTMQAAALPSSWSGLSGSRPLLADERRSHGKRCVVPIPFKGTVWTARLESDGDDGWWIEALQVDGQWLDALEVFSPMFLDDLEHAHRSAAA